MFYKFHHHLVTYHSQQKPDQTTERTTHTATSPTAGHSTDILPPDHPRMEQPAPGNSGSQVCGLFQVQAYCPPVTRQTTPPLPPPLLFLMSTTPPPSAMPHTLSLHFRSVYCNLLKSA